MGRREAIVCTAVALQQGVIYPGFMDSLEAEVVISKEDSY